MLQQLQQAAQVAREAHQDEVHHLVAQEHAAGVGGLAGNLVTSAVASSVTTAGSELSWSTVEADGKRLANNVAKSLGQFFVTQGWIASVD